MFGKFRRAARFDKFRAAFGPLQDDVAPTEPWHHERFAGVAGYEEFAAEFAGATFDRGLYRFHDAASGPLALLLVEEAFPENAGSVCPFGYDWLGRQIAVDLARIENGQPQVLLFDVGDGHVYEVPSSFVDFHDRDLIKFADATLGSGWFAEWSPSNGDILPLGRDQCMGYRIALFLNGAADIENLELSDIDVYWTIFGQMRVQVFGDA